MSSPARALTSLARRSATRAALVFMLGLIILTLTAQAILS